MTIRRYADDETGYEIVATEPVKVAGTINVTEQTAEDMARTTRMVHAAMRLSDEATDPMHSDGGVRLTATTAQGGSGTAPHRSLDSATPGEWDAASASMRGVKRLGNTQAVLLPLLESLDDEWPKATAWVVTELLRAIADNASAVRLGTLRLTIEPPAPDDRLFADTLMFRAEVLGVPR